MFEPQKFKVAGNTLRLVKRIGFRRADEVVGLLYDWQAFMREHGRPPTGFEEYVRWTSRAGRGTSYRHLAQLRQAFPEAGPEALPTDFLHGVLGELESADVDAAVIE